MEGLLTEVVGAEVSECRGAASCAAPGLRFCQRRLRVSVVDVDVVDRPRALPRRQHLLDR
jgi:hypothetical protein